MRKISILAAILAFTPFISCNKAEVIPAPATQIELKVHFQGTFNGTGFEWTKNVNGFAHIAAIESSVDPGNGLTRLRYYSGMNSTSDSHSIKIGIGSLQHDSKVSEYPTLSTFESFVGTFEGPGAPGFSDGAQSGFEILYTDAAGDVFRSEQATQGNYTFTDVVTKQDTEGDYIQFTCNFDGILYHRRMDTINKMVNVQNAVLTGWFKRTN